MLEYVIPLVELKEKFKIKGEIAGILSTNKDLLIMITDKKIEAEPLMARPQKKKWPIPCKQCKKPILGRSREAKYCKACSYTRTLTRKRKYMRKSAKEKTEPVIEKPKEKVKEPIGGFPLGSYTPEEKSPFESEL